MLNFSKTKTTVEYFDYCRQTEKVQEHILEVTAFFIWASLFGFCFLGLWFCLKKDNVGIGIMSQLFGFLGAALINIIGEAAASAYGRYRVRKFIK